MSNSDNSNTSIALDDANYRVEKLNEKMANSKDAMTALPIRWPSSDFFDMVNHLTTRYRELFDDQSKVAAALKSRDEHIAALEAQRNELLANSTQRDSTTP